MPAFIPVPDFLEALAEKVHDLANDSLVVALSNTAPDSESPDPTTSGNGVLANVTEISYTNLSSRAITITSSDEASGTYKLVLSPLELSASGGSVAEFRYIYIYNDTPTSPADPIIGYIDYGSGKTLADGEAITLNFSAANGVLQIAAA